MSPPPSPLLVGLIGVGHLGKVHARCLAALEGPSLRVAGVYDVDPEAAAAVAAEYGWRRFGSLGELLGRCDAVDVVTPTTTHRVVVGAALEAGRHVFVEKPVTATAAEARELEALAEARGLLVQVGHVERFNPAFAALETRGLRPVFAEAHRLAPFNPRGNDVSVVLDLMIHDLDLVLSLLPAPVASVRANGVAVTGKTVDIANARLDFDDGATANLTASRISLKAMRKLRLFQRDAYIGIDLLGKSTEVVRLSDHDPAHPGPLQLPVDGQLREVVVEQPTVPPVNAIQEELRRFAESVRAGKPAVVGLADGRRALDVAQLILDDIEARRARIESARA